MNDWINTKSNIKVDKLAWAIVGIMFWLHGFALHIEKNDSRMNHGTAWSVNEDA